MKPYEMLKLPVLLLGFGSALVLVPTSKAQEVSPDHFTDAGVQNVYQAASQQAVAPKPSQTPKALQARKHQAESLAAPRLTATRNSSVPPQPGALAIADKRKTAPRKPKKP
jgi:hypothetical protein